MKRKRPAIRSCSGLLLAGTVLFHVSYLPAQNPSAGSGQAIPIAVVEFEGNGISQTEAIALTDRLRNELFRLGVFEVVERGMMETILTEQDFQLTGCTSNECLVEVEQLLGARQVVGGRISRVGAMFTVSARVVDVQTGKLLGVSDFDLRGGLEEMLTSGMNQVAVKLSNRNTSSKSSIEQSERRQQIEKKDGGILGSVESRYSTPNNWQVLLGMLGGDDYGFNTEITRFLGKRAIFDKIVVQPAISIGFLSRHLSFEEDDNYKDDRRLYISMAINKQMIDQLIGGNIFFGIGIGFGQFNVDDDYVGERYIGNDSKDPDPVIYIGGQVSVKIMAFRLMLEARLLNTSMYGTSTIINAGIQL